ncbi:MAG: hypothetical protein KAW12_18960 [Candidatus Aminicenantes bacterium]|nr:hypothetical protein [Candidatus Aminicenantes bacterium]
MVSKILDEVYTRPITLDLLYRAKQELILRRDTHLDSLADKLKEERGNGRIDLLVKFREQVFAFELTCKLGMLLEEFFSGFYKGFCSFYRIFQIFNSLKSSSGVTAATLPSSISFSDCPIRFLKDWF